MLKHSFALAILCLFLDTYVQKTEFFFNPTLTKGQKYIEINYGKELTQNLKYRKNNNIVGAWLN